MINTPFDMFEKEMTNLWLAYGRAEPEPSVVKVYFDGLQGYHFNDVKMAFYQNARTGSRSGFVPTLPQVIASLPNAVMSIDKPYLRTQLVKPTSTVGVLVRCYVGSTNIKNFGDPKFEGTINTLIESFLNELPAITQEITVGRGFSKCEIKAIKSGRHGHVDAREFAGIQISRETMQLNIERGALLDQEHKELEYLDEEGNPVILGKKDIPAAEVSQFINKILSDIEQPVKPTRLEKSECLECAALFESILKFCPICQTERPK